LAQALLAQGKGFSTFSGVVVLSHVRHWKPYRVCVLVQDGVDGGLLYVD